MPQISLIIPTRNESQTICQCIQRAQEAFKRAGLSAEIIVSDSSTDQTADIAASCGGRVVFPQRLGYGNAYLLGFQEARGDYIFLMDGDLTYDPEAILDMLPLLESGQYDLVMGSRLKGRILPGAMPALHQYLGNPLLTWILNRLFSAGISDAHCGLRGMTRDALNRLDLRSGGMEFASEMVIEAASRGLRIAEVPITYHPRQGSSKLNSFTDGWRHLRFMMLYRPGPFLLLPGLLALLLGLILAVAVYMQGGSRMHSLILGGLLLIIGYQMLLAGLHFRAFSAAWGLSRSGGMERLISYHSLEKELLIGLALLAGGIIIGLDLLMSWRGAGFGALDAAQNAMLAMILTILGIQTIFSGMFISLLLLYRSHQDGD
ncbi:glycosyltransferase family 2 protein [Methanothrix sp.]|uniref:glycosyltransferase family 2 protein n=1 Tax=Methanothrix sp. TaxID=90426 RepID=UPI001BD629D8